MSVNDFFTQNTEDSEFDEMISELLTASDESDVEEHTRGSRLGRPVDINKYQAAGVFQLHQDYFVDVPVDPAEKFNCPYRISHDIFLFIMQKSKEKYPFF